jgi:hypothetical protein
MLRRLERRLGAVARRKWLAILAVGLAPLLVRALLLPWFPAPNPRVQDEFSHLLVADTFAHGRLVNPVHPMWVHFESMHILVRPVYASVFPVAQGLVMAIGQVLTRHPWSGVWLSAGFMCAALCWMLQGWVSPGWALLGGILAVARFGVFSYWMNSYYGGAVAAAGGALVLGALPRVWRRRDWRDAAAMGAGLAILANSRPYEGALFALPVMAALLWGMWGRALWGGSAPGSTGRVLTRRRGGAEEDREKGRDPRIHRVADPAENTEGRSPSFARMHKPEAYATVSFLTPLVLVLGATALLMGVYFARLSGSPLRLPYSFYRSTFTMAPHFIWQSPRPEPVYHQRVLRDFHTHWEMAAWDAARANRAPYGIFDKAKTYWRFYLGPVLSVPFLTLPWLCRRLRTRLLLIAGILFSLGLAVEVWHAPHYAAPALGLCLLLVVQALRQLRQTAGAFAVRAIVLAAVLTPVVGGSAWDSDGRQRARVLRELAAKGGQHLVLVRYRMSHDCGDEWVYNAADIDRAPVVWAREMDPTSNRKLVDYFRNRKVWLVQPDARPPLLSPYDPASPPDPPFRFFKMGTDAVDALRSPEDIRRRMLQKVTAEYPPPYRFGCDQWAYFFTELTGVESPDLAQGCFPPGQRGRLVATDEWFAWLEKQR